MNNATTSAILSAATKPVSKVAKATKGTKHASNAKKSRKAAAVKRVKNAVAPVVTPEPVAVAPVVVDTVNPLATRAVLVRLYVPSIPQYKKDKDASAKVQADNNVKDGDKSARVQKTLMSGPEMKACTNAAQKLRNYLKSAAAPWFDGVFIIAAPRVTEVLSKGKELMRELELAVIDLADKVDLVIEADKIRLDGLFDQSDYISRGMLLAKSKAVLEVMPVPADFRSGMVSDAIAEETNKALTQRINEAKTDLLQRLAGKLRHAVSTISTAHEKRFVSSNVSNIVDMANEVFSCLFDGDERLAKLCESLKAEFSPLCTVEAIDAIKDEASSVARDEAKAKAEKALAEVEAAMSMFAV